MIHVYIFTGTREFIPEHFSVIDSIIRSLRGPSQSDIKKFDKNNFVIHGDATGVDSTVNKLCEKYSVPHQKFYADWKRYGKFAGPRRNEEMVLYALSKSTLSDITAFALPYPTLEKSIGTHDTVKRCKEKGINVFVIELEA